MKQRFSKLIVLLLALAMVFALAGCSGFIKDGWDYEAKGIKYDKGFAQGQVVEPDKAAQKNVYTNADGTGGFMVHDLKGPCANGEVIDTAGTPESVNTTTNPAYE